MGASHRIAIGILVVVWLLAPACSRPDRGRAPLDRSANYNALVRLFEEWRAFQRPKVVEGVPDYTRAAMDEQRRGLARFQARLAAIDHAAWPVSEQIDYRLVEAEMNGLDFDHRVMHPWSRNPAFYTVVHASPTDVPAREGPERAGALCLYEYAFPLSDLARAAVRVKLRAVPRLLDQARGNLTEEARDLWFAGIDVKRQESVVLAHLIDRLAAVHPDLVADARQAKEAVDRFRGWLETRHARMTAPSGIGTANYDWYLKNVHLMPTTWQEQRSIVERELQRAWASLALEETRNRDLPALVFPTATDESQKRMDEAVAVFFRFLDERAVVTLPAYMRTTLDRKVGSMPPPGELVDFFGQIELRDSLPMRCHGTHWFDLARMANEPHGSPIRRTVSLYNIWDSRAEGLATAFEEMMLEAGLFDARPRARELVYVLLANRAARAMGDLMMHGGGWTLEQAVKYAVENTPRGWLSAKGRTVWFDEQLYLQQPGYGTSYVVGKVQLEGLLADRRRQAGEAFTLRRFMDDLNAAGMVPVSLIRWEMTGSR